MVGLRIIIGPRQLRARKRARFRGRRKRISFLCSVPSAQGVRSGPGSLSTFRVVLISSAVIATFSSSSPDLRKLSRERKIWWSWHTFSTMGPAGAKSQNTCRTGRAIRSKIGGIPVWSDATSKTSSLSWSSHTTCKRPRSCRKRQSRSKFWTTSMRCFSHRLRNCRLQPRLRTILSLSSREIIASLKQRRRSSWETSSRSIRRFQRTTNRTKRCSISYNFHLSSHRAAWSAASTNSRSKWLLRQLSSNSSRWCWERKKCKQSKSLVINRINICRGKSRAAWKESQTCLRFIRTVKQPSWKLKTNRK